jgi:LmbE family N-acetylglucosaminyl deacetylase
MKVLAIFAHPDDETILIGGTLAMLTSHGAELHILSATRGEGGELGEPPAVRRAELGAVRGNELRCALNALGGTSLQFLGYIDPTIEVGQEGLAFEADPGDLSDQIGAHIVGIQPNVILTHGSNGEYGHPAHLLVHETVLTAACQRSVCTYGISASFTGHPRPRLANDDDPAHFILDISASFNQKLAAAACHSTQRALFVRRSSQEAGRPLELADVLMRVESLHRFIPSDQETPDPLSRFLESHCPEALLPLEHPSDPIS